MRAPLADFSDLQLLALFCYFRTSRIPPGLKSEMEKAMPDYREWEFSAQGEQKRKESEEAFFNEIISRFNIQLARLLSSRYGYLSEFSDEVLQETWVQILLALPRFDLSRPFFPWAAQILLRTARVHFRKFHMRADSVPPENRLRLQADKRRNPEESYLEAEMSDKLRQGLQKLDDLDYQILYLRFFSGIKMNDLPSLLGISRSNVFERYQRAIKKLKKYLA